jgi:hypothetical protein
MIGIAVLLVMLVLPGLVWLGFHRWAQERTRLRLTGASLLPPLLLVAALALDAAINGTAADKPVSSKVYVLLFLFELALSIGVAGACEAWLGKKTDMTRG